MPMIREAAPDELPAVMNILDAALLDVAASTVSNRIQAGDVVVATDDERLIGACVLDSTNDPTRILAVAIRPRRRDTGIGSSLLESVCERVGPVTAEFDEAVCPFYETLGFDIEPIDQDRYRGWRE